MSLQRTPTLLLFILMAFQVHSTLTLAGQDRQGPRSTGAGHAMERSDPGAEPALEPFPLDRERVVLRVTMEATDVGGSTSKIGDASSSTTVGGQAAVGVGATQGLCADYTGPLDRSREHSPWTAHDWEVTATFLDARTDRFTFDLQWVRWDRDAKSRRIHGRGDTRRITLKENEEHVLDFVEVLDAGSVQHCNTNVVVRIDVSIKEDPQLADTELTYDLWFVEREGNEVVESTNASMPARQGQKAKIDFDEIHHDLGRASDGGPYVVADLVATVIGRARRDSSIDLSVSASRWFRVAYPDHPVRGGIGMGGRLYVNVQPGEVVELTMPQSTHGGHTNYRDPENYVKTRDLYQEGQELMDDPDWDGSIVTDDSAMVRFGRYFEDRRFSLMLSARVAD